MPFAGSGVRGPQADRGCAKSEEKPGSSLAFVRARLGFPWLFRRAKANKGQEKPSKAKVRAHRAHKKKAAASCEAAAQSRGRDDRDRCRRAYCAICDFLLLSNFQNT